MSATVGMAGTISINFTGMNLVYDGSAIYDAGSNAGGFLNPADADPLTTVNFYVDGVVQGSPVTDGSLDVFIPDVSNIPAASGTDFTMTTPGNPGFFDLLIGSPVASEYLALDLNEVTVKYFDLSGFLQFVFGAAVADIGGQNLPFGLQIGDPVTVSFSAQLDSGSRTTSGGFVTGFTASGTGEIRGTAIPEPAAALLLVLGGLAMPVLRRRLRS